MDMNVEMDNPRETGESIVPKKARKQKPAGKSSGKRGFLPGFLLGVFLIALMIGGAGAAFYMDINDLQQTAVQMLRLDEKTFEYLESQLSELDSATSDLEIGEKQLKIEQAGLEQERAELAEKQAELDEQEATLDALALSMTDQKAELDSIVKLYEAMEPDVAASILGINEDLTQTTIILKHMQSSKLAEILAELPAVQASDLINLMAGGSVEQSENNDDPVEESPS